MSQIQICPKCGEVGAMGTGECPGPRHGELAGPTGSLARIFKYPLNLDDRLVVAMPKGAQILTAQIQYDVICLWAIVSPESEMQKRVIEIFGTGHPMDNANRVYIGTVITAAGALVWHIFERLENDQ